MSLDPNKILHNIHTVSGQFALTGSNYADQITGLNSGYSTGDPSNLYIYTKIIQEFNKKLLSYGLTGYNFDPIDGGLRPKTLTGFFDPSVNIFLN